MGLPNDEIFRRCKRALFRGVYASPGPISDGLCAIFVICEAQKFNAQLPLTPRGAWRAERGEGDGTGEAQPSRTRMFASEDFHILGYIKAFTNLRSLQIYANAHLRNSTGFYYVLQVDAEKLTDVKDITVEDEEEMEAAADEVVLDSERWGAAEGHGNQVHVHGMINAEAIDRVWVAERAGEKGNTLQFIDCTMPGGHNVPAEFRT